MAVIRRERGLTQEQLADKIGLHADTVRTIEQGRRWVRLTTLHKFAKGLDVSIDELFKGLK